MIIFFILLQLTIILSTGFLAYLHENKKKLYSKFNTQNKIKLAQFVFLIIFPILAFTLTSSFLIYMFYFDILLGILYLGYLVLLFTGFKFIFNSIYIEVAFFPILVAFIAFALSISLEGNKTIISETTKTITLYNCENIVKDSKNTSEMSDILIKLFENDNELAYTIMKYDNLTIKEINNELNVNLDLILEEIDYKIISDKKNYLEVDIVCFSKKNILEQFEFFKQMYPIKTSITYKLFINSNDIKYHSIK